MAQIFFPEATVAEYITNKGLKCPICGNKTLETEPGTINFHEPMELTTEVTCLECGASFNDVYELTGLETITD